MGDNVPKWCFYYNRTDTQHKMVSLRPLFLILVSANVPAGTPLAQWTSAVVGEKEEGRK